MSDHFRPLGDPSGYELIDPIQQHFEDKGWRPSLGPGSRWVEHLYESDNGTLRVQYLPDERDFDVAFQTGPVGAELYVTLPENYRPILDVVTRYQDILSAERWPSFVQDFMAVSPRVFAVTDDEDEVDIELGSSEIAAAFLREGEWIISDDDSDALGWQT